MAGSSPIQFHIGTVPPMEAFDTRLLSGSPLALKQIGHVRYVPPAAANLRVSSASGGQPSHATPTATSWVASRTASLVEEHQRRAPEFGGTNRDEEGHGHLLRVFQPGSQTDDCLAHRVAPFDCPGDAFCSHRWFSAGC